ncbi:MAG TPA: SMI1/KNR4 family protein [Candidatus Sulfotelmatobacter sp.]|jgi:hypothetical protein|nr:SMI1/KNR4 family protein [Candidatus Sulfotelmatobacter sp.]
MNKTEWEKFLSEYNRELLSYEEVVERLSSELIKAGWLGYAGTTEEEITAAEKRLAVKLPPSFRTFLKVSNGWRYPSEFIFDLLPVSKLIWFREKNQGWIDAYTNPSGELPTISDEEYFVYGNKQDSVNLRPEYLQAALQVSELGDSAVVLLNPKVVTSEGEWETWFFANWLPGAERHRSFGEWLAAERIKCHKLFKALPKAQVKKLASVKKPGSVKKATEAARSGQAELALEALESFAAKGDTAAALPLAEFYAYLDKWDKVISFSGKSLADNVFSTSNDFQEMVKLLACAGHRLREWRKIAEVAEVALKANSTRQFDKYHEHVREFYDEVFHNLISYANRQGAAPHDLFARNLEKMSEAQRLAIIAARAFLAEPKTEFSQKQREEKYQQAVQMADTNPLLKPHMKTIHVKMEYVFGQIKSVWPEKALELYETYGENFAMNWEGAIYVAKIYAQRGDPEGAWSAIKKKLGKWWPAPGLGIIAPITLLMDEHLKALMTPQRCQIVLSTPRGPEALKK